MSFGEDIVLLALINRAGWILNKDIANGCKKYIDIGCYHPINHSNTYMFYKQFGWDGILIDPNDSFREAIHQERPRDVFVNAAITDSNGERPFFFFSEGASSNTMDEKFAEWISTSQNVNASCRNIRTYTLDSIIELYNITELFLINIDAEGSDKTIIKSYSWRVRPVFVIIEDWDHETKRSDPEIEKILSDNGYEKMANLYLSSIYLDRNTDIFKALS